MSPNDEMPVQCLCGRRLLPVPRATLISRSFTGVECDSGCRGRFERSGIVDTPPPTRRTPPDQYRRRTTVGDRRRQTERNAS